MRVFASRWSSWPHVPAVCRWAPVYGSIFMLFNTGTGLGQALSGRAFDRFHSYSQILSGYEIVLAVTCVPCSVSANIRFLRSST
jgi:hypothetical protein